MLSTKCRCCLVVLIVFTRLSLLLGIRLFACPLPPIITDGSITSEKKDVYLPGDYVEFECNVGYSTVRGSLHLICDETGKWDDYFPECHVVKCTRPEIPSNGNIKELRSSNSQEFPFAFELTYSCSSTYRLVGPKSRLCDVQGWTGQVPACELIKCEGTPMLEYGRAVSGRSKMLYYPGEELEVLCDIGYTWATPNHYILCDESGKWNILASCIPILCNFPDVPPHAVLEASKENQYRFGDIVDYSCEEGYFLRGKKHRTCEQGGWSGRPPTCIEVTCFLPELPRNGIMTQYKELYKYRETVEYSCQSRNILHGGSRNRTCTETGWTGTVPTCYVVGCEHLTIPNGQLQARPNSYGYQSLGKYATVVCNHKYWQYGSDLYCSWAGKWQGRRPICVEVTCPAVGDKMLASNDRRLYYPGENITMNCPDHFQPVDGNSMITCLDNGKWSGNLATCVAESCPEPPLIENGELILLFEENKNKRSYFPNQRVRISCNSGYTTLGKEERNKCMENGRWQNPFPTCTVITCKKPAVPANGNLKPGENSSQSTFIFNSLAEYECNVGYRLVGDTLVRCGDSGWSGQIPHCKEIQCPKTFRDSAGNIEAQSENPKYGDVVQVTCYKQYRLIGHGSVTCMEDGNWSKKPQHLCEAITCYPPKVPAFGFLSVEMPKYRLHQVVTFRCQQGFYLKGKVHLTCLESGWSDKTPQCEAIEVSKCPEPPVIPHGKILTTENREYTTGDRVNFVCDRGYFASSANEYVYCGVNGSWNLSAAHCQEDLQLPCLQLPVIVHSQLKDVRNKTYFPGDNITVVCDPGYYSPLDDDYMYIACSNNGLWDFTAVQPCQAIVCEMSPLTSNLSIVEGEVGEKVSFGFEINFRCAPGYYLVGPRWSICDENGWSKETPICKKVKCYDPGFPEGGQRLGSSFNVGDKVTFSCFSGFTLIGDSERICLPSGQWSGRLTRCNSAKNYCINPGVPINGVKTGSRYMLGEVVDFRCKSGFTLVGPRRRICLHNKLWKGKETRCLGQHEFDTYDKMSDGVKTVIETIKKMQATELEVSRSQKVAVLEPHVSHSQLVAASKPHRIIVYFVLDTSSSIGRRNFKITIQFMKAIVKYLDITEDGIRVGLITFSKNAKVEFLPEKYNNTVSVLKALDELDYTEGGTKLEAALKLLHDDVIPSTKKRFNIPSFQNSRSVRLDPRLKSVAFVLTDGKFSLSDNPEALARRLRADVKFLCFGLTGYPRKDVLHSVVTSRADQIAFMDSYDRLEQLTEELLLKKNDYKCGVTSEESEGHFWPWIAYVGLAAAQTNSIICRGSLISSTWILTSASCVEAQSLMSKLQSPFLNVYFDGSEQDHNVLLVVTHPLFQPNTSDFDIALLKLKVPVEFSAMLRPVCLPPANFGETELYQENAKAYMTVGKVEDNQYYVERNLALPIQSNDTCGGNLNSERMFCAGDGTVHSELCDPRQRGSPMLQYQRNEENRLCWTQVGIHVSNKQCTSGSYYIQFTHVAKLRNWLDEVIQTN